MKIYVIVAGAYSDYHVCDATDDLEKAKLIQAANSDICDAASILEFDTGNPKVDIKADKNSLFHYEIRKDRPSGKVWIHSRGFSCLPYENLEGINKVFKLDISTSYGLFTMARNDDEALKIAYDRFAQAEEKESYDDPVHGNILRG